MTRGALASLVLTAALWAGPAQALQIFTDRAAWEAALAGASITTDPFANNIAGGTTITFDSGVVSTGTPAASTFQNLVSAGRYSGLVDGGEDPSTIYFDTITWTFPVPIIGFGMDLFGSVTSDGLTFTGNFDGTGDQTVSVFDFLGAFSDGFLGVIGLAPFTSIVLNDANLASTTGEGFDADNLSFASPAAAPVPEPGTLALFGAGLAGLSCIARKRKAA